MKEKKT